MPSALDTHLDALQKALHTLIPAGNDGFEGLLAVVLTAVCEQPFRLASSGSQRGRDGDSAFDGGATYFEGKRYDDDVPKKEIAVKLMDLKADNQGQVDTWVVGATSSIPALNASGFRAQAESDGIGIVLLDWSKTTLPPLAIAVSMAETAAKNFLIKNLADPAQASILAEGCAAIDHLRLLPEFAGLAAALRDQLKSPSVGLGLAKAANRAWLKDIFVNRARARQRFGQPVAPNDPTGMATRERKTLSDALKPAFQGKPANNTFVVIGPEGVGKTWLVATTWLAADPQSFLVFATAEELRDPDDLQGLEEFFIRKVISQSGSDYTEGNQKRWRRRFAAWRENPGPANVRLTLCVDGLNQKPRFPWPRWIDAASLLLESLGGQLIVTTRTSHFPSLRQAMAAPLTRINVTEWSNVELNAALQERGVDPNGLSADVFERLKNPRILDIAVNLLDARAIEKIEELSVGRLLFEHLANRISPEPLRSRRPSLPRPCRTWERSS